MKTYNLVHCCVLLMFVACFGMPLAAAQTQADYEKNLQIQLGYQNGEYTVISQEISFGKSPNLAILSGPIKGIITDNKGSELTVFYLSDPGIATGDLVNGPSGTDLAPYREHRASGELSLVLPVIPGMQTVSLYDTRTGVQLVSVEIQPAFTTFCLDYLHDPDCTAREIVQATNRSVPDTGQILVVVFEVSIIAAGLILFLTTRRKEKPAPPAVKQTVLVVDDSPDIIEIVSYVLTGKGYTCISASSGEECLDMLKCRVPDVVLLDVGMAPMDGWQTLEQIRKNPDTKSVPVLMLTAYQLTAVVARQYKICIDDYITKPFRMDELGAAINNILERKRKLKASLVIAKKAGVDMETFCEFARLTRSISVNRRIIDILQAPMAVPRFVDMDTLDVMSVADYINIKTRDLEKRAEQLRHQINSSFRSKGLPDVNL